MNMKSKLLTVFLIVLVLFSLSSVVAASEVEQQSQFQAPIVIVNTSFLNVRTGPGAQYTVLMTVVGGTEFPVLGIGSDGVWYQVTTSAGVGWINSQFALPRGDFANVPEISIRAARAAADALAAETETEMLSTASTDSFGQRGFSEGREWGISLALDQPLRNRPSTGAISMASVPADNGVIYEILEGTSSEGAVWYRIAIAPDVTGWVEADKVRLRPFGCQFTVVRFNKEMGPTIGPDGSGNLDGSVPYPGDSEAYLLDAQDGFYKVEMIDGNVGWVESGSTTIRGETFSEFCSSGRFQRSNVNADGTTDTGETRSSMPRFDGPTIVINTGFLNIRSGPGAQYTVVSTLAGGTEVEAVGLAPDGVWYLVEGTFGRGWMNIEFGLFRGDGSNLPVIRDAVGEVEIARPVASITNAVTLYAAPDTELGIVGALSGPLEVNVVARTEDFEWVQLATDLGFGWVRASQVTLRGDTNLIPVIRV